jgi:hypothetical protein
MAAARSSRSCTRTAHVFPGQPVPSPCGLPLFWALRHGAALFASLAHSPLHAPPPPTSHKDTRGGSLQRLRRDHNVPAVLRVSSGAVLWRHARAFGPGARAEGVLFAGAKARHPPNWGTWAVLYPGGTCMLADQVCESGRGCAGLCCGTWRWLCMHGIEQKGPCAPADRKFTLTPPPVRRSSTALQLWLRRRPLT